MTRFNIEDPTTFNHQFAELACGVNYHYVDEGPIDGPLVVLLHGFPEFWYTWKYQIEHLSNLGFRVIVPDMIGYCQTTLKPEIDQLQAYTFEFSSIAIKSLIYDHVIKDRQNKEEKIIVIGHDWGSFTAWRFANNFPQCLDVVIGLSLPYVNPGEKFEELDKQIEQVPLLGYQKAMADCNLEKLNANLDKVLSSFWNRQLIDVPIYTVITVPIGTEFLDHAYSFEGKVNEKVPGSQFMNYMVSEYSRQGMQGPTNWYRTHRANFENDLKHLNKTIDLPALTIIGKYDFTCSWIEKGAAYLKNNQLEIVDKAGHWIQISHYEFVNSKIETFLKEKLGDKFPKN